MLGGRKEFVLLAFSIPLLLLTLCRKLPVKKQRRLVRIVTALLVIRISLLPFLAPAFEYARQSEYETFINRDGICLQSNGYNCGPAAAVTVWRHLGLPAEESALALAAKTTRFSGTPADGLVDAINAIYAVECEIEYPGNIEHLNRRDPLSGMKQLTHSEFNRIWRRQIILIPEAVICPMPGIIQALED
jgi:hypothetical protein